MGVSFKAHQLGLPLKARSRATDPASTDFNWTESEQIACILTTGVTPAAVEPKFGPDAVSAASLAGAVGIQRMGGEDAHADQGEDTC